MCVWHWTSGRSQGMRPRCDAGAVGRAARVRCPFACDCVRKSASVATERAPLVSLHSSLPKPAILSRLASPFVPGSTCKLTNRPARQNTENQWRPARAPANTAHSSWINFLFSRNPLFLLGKDDYAQFFLIWVLFHSILLWNMWPVSTAVALISYVIE